MENIKINYYDFNKNVLPDIKDPVLDGYPIVYILNNDLSHPEAYIGQTVQVKSRMKNHLTNKDRKKLDKMILIGHDKFNQSATYDIETNLINHFIADEKYKLQNKSQTAQQMTHNYYDKSYYHSVIFEDIWDKLRKDGIVKHTIEDIRNRDVFKLSPFKELSEAQMDLKTKIIEFCNNHINDDKKAVFLIKGDAGTGKSVVLSSTFNTIQDLSKNKDFIYLENTIENNLFNSKNYLLVNHNEMLKTYVTISESLTNLKKNNFLKPTSFINKSKSEKIKADITLVDEAHLLLTRPDSFNSFKENNQLEEIIKHSKVTIIVYDERQYLKIKSSWSENILKKILKGTNSEEFVLDSQFRMQADQDVINWLDAFVNKEIRKLPNSNSEEFEFKFFDNASRMHQAIVEKNEEFKLSRVVSTFDYVHKKDGNDYFVDEPDFSLAWNRTDYKSTWAEEPQTIREVGSIYTIQGFDLNYVGVILGPSIGYDKENHCLKIDVTKYRDTEAFRQSSEEVRTKEELIKMKEQIILNSMNVLLKRGVKGLYIYASNEELRKVLLNGGLPLESRNH
ncbi:DUF2075 domain-containing protein [Macrococcus sp. S115]|uniref:DUF2075 domain-containing protein n=1 Tax=Macrococcus sp. S115 TaxID=3047480 RepID=UPI0024BC8B98|nr:DUF2075 domain-containing protein [Macrococcus sp. S115]MDJ1112535.1 DUF2075 domain-containing protein [Macrococcus sp. S115]